MMTLYPLQGLGEVTPETPLEMALLDALRRQGEGLETGDILVVAQKVVSKAEGREVLLDAVEPGEKARSLAAEGGMNPALAQLILDESACIMSVRRGVCLCRHRLGWICANAGIDASNTTGEGRVILLPKDPDLSAQRLSAAWEAETSRRCAVIISDTHGRALRKGITGVAIGSYGIAPLKRYAGRKDRRGRPLTASLEAVADELAAAAGLLMGQADEGIPAVLVRGYPHAFSAEGIAALKRPPEEELFTPKEEYHG